LTAFQCPAAHIQFVGVMQKRWQAVIDEDARGHEQAVLHRVHHSNPKWPRLVPDAAAPQPMAVIGGWGA
jgi:hypothetical protein